MIGDFYFSLDKTLNPIDYLGLISDKRIKDLTIYHPNIRELTTFEGIISRKLRQCNWLFVEGELNVVESKISFEVVIVPTSRKLVSKKLGFFTCSLFTSTESQKLHESLFQHNSLEELYKENEDDYLESIRSAIASKELTVQMYFSRGRTEWRISKNRIYYKVSSIGIIV